MNPKEQRIAIAGACGWTNLELKQLFETEEDNVKLALVGSPPGITGGGKRVPDYLNDLNACHEMEKSLTDDQTEDYLINLAWNDRDKIMDEHVLAFATAAQRAEAFLKTLNLWEDAR